MRNSLKGFIICVCVAVVFYIGVFFIKDNIPKYSIVHQNGNSVDAVGSSIDEAIGAVEKFENLENTENEITVIYSEK